MEKPKKLSPRAQALYDERIIRAEEMLLGRPIPGEPIGEMGVKMGKMFMPIKPSIMTT